MTNMKKTNILFPYTGISCPEKDSPRTVSLSSEYCSSMCDDKPSLAAQLPSSYEPSPYSVICGRGKDCFNHVGNCRFRVIVNLFQERYADADNKAAKGEIVTEVLEMIRSAGGSFIKYKNGSWWEVSEAVAREKVGSLFRDVLHSQYRSSAKSKTERRRQKKGDNRNLNPLHFPVRFMGLRDLNFAPACSSESERGMPSTEAAVISCNNSISSGISSALNAEDVQEIPVLSSSTQSATVGDTDPLIIEDSWPEGWEIEELNQDDSLLFQEMTPEAIFSENYL